MAGLFDRIIDNLPEVAHPRKRLSFKEKLTWTGVVLVLYFVLTMVPLYGLNPQALAQFETLSILLAAEFGSIISLGIGPIVTASIILQLLVGADVLKINLKSTEGRKTFQGLQKLFGIFFIIFENALYVISGALPPANNTFANISLLVIQLIIGGIVLLFLDEVVSKWGFGSGISLFIAASVSRQIFVNAFNPLPDPANPTISLGAIPQSIQFVLQGIPQYAIWPMIAVGATVLVFVLSTYFQSIKVEIPLSFGRIRGFGVRWPLNFIYTSNIPVIFTAAMIASLQFWGLMMFNMGIPLIGTYEKVDVGGQMREVPSSGLAMYLEPPSVRDMVTHGMTVDYTLSLLIYSGLMIGGAVLFSILWMHIGGQDPSNVADQILSSGLSIPGFRRDKRILTKMLSRYINPLTIIGGASVGMLAVLADVLGALSRGTGILLAVMIIYGLYEQLAKYHMGEIHPAVRKFLGEE